MTAKEQYYIYSKPGCPFGQKAVDALKTRGLDYVVSELSTESEVMEFKNKHGVKTTPQIFLGETRIGGYTDLAATLGVGISDAGASPEKSYLPVAVVFGTALMMTLATAGGIRFFMGFSLCLLAMLKLMDLKSFQKSFSQYDLITRRWSSFGFIYPFLELFSGLGFLSGALNFLTGIIAAFAGLTGGYSVYRAVIVEKKNLNCACIGGNSQVPLGLVSFSENAMMALMGLSMLI